MASCESMRLKLQRDLNCLADHDRITRRKGMQRLRATLQDPKTGMPNYDALGSPAPMELAAFFSAHLREPLVRLFGDGEVELCREMSARLVVMFAREVLPHADQPEKQASDLAARALPMLVARIGVNPCPEGTEEIRLCLIQFTALLVSMPGALPPDDVGTIMAGGAADEDAGVGEKEGGGGSGGAVAGGAADNSEDSAGPSMEGGGGVGGGVCAVLVRSLADPYPEVKRESCGCVRALVAQRPAVVARYGAALMKGCVGILGHQHSKTRQLTLQALGQLVVCCAGPAAGLVDSVNGGSSSSSDSTAGSSGKENAAAMVDDETLEAAMGSEEGTAAAAAAAVGSAVVPLAPHEGAAGSLRDRLRKSLVDVVFPALHKAGSDRSPTVRFTLARCAGFLLRARPSKTRGLALLELEGGLVRILLALTVDNADDVQRISHECLLAAADHWADHAPGNPAGPSTSAALASAHPLPPREAFACSESVQPNEVASYTSPAVVALVAHHGSSVGAELLQGSRHWTVGERVKSLDSLASLVRIGRGDDAGGCAGSGASAGGASGGSGGFLGALLPGLVECLCHCLPDDEVEVAEAARRCAAGLGASAACGAALALALPRVAGKEGPGTDTPQHRAAALLLVAGMLGRGGARDGAAKATVPLVCRALGGDPSLLLQGWDSEGGSMEPKLAEALLSCCSSVVVRLTGGSSSGGGGGSVVDGGDRAAAAGVEGSEGGIFPQGCGLAAKGGGLEVCLLVRALGQLMGCRSDLVGEGVVEDATALVEDVAAHLYAPRQPPLPPSNSSASSSASASSSSSGGGGGGGALAYDEAVVAQCVTQLFNAHLGTLLDLCLDPRLSAASLAERGATNSSPFPPPTPSSSSSKHGSAGGELPKWRNSDPSRRAFDALLRCGASAAGPLLAPKIVPVVCSHVAGPVSVNTPDADLKLSMLCLLEVLLSRPESAPHWPPLAVTIVQQALTLNMVWKAGRVNSTVRKVSLACFYALLHKGYADRPALFTVAPGLLPILKTDLDDFDASTRELVCLSLDIMFRHLPGALSEQPVMELYPTLLKRLDDSSDPVRVAVCGCFVSFFGAAPPAAFLGTTIDYCLDQLLVHLDDADPKMQHLIFEVLKATLPIDAPRVARKALASRPSHRSPALIDNLITLANAAS